MTFNKIVSGMMSVLGTAAFIASAQIASAQATHLPPAPPTTTVNVNTDGVVSGAVVDASTTTTSNAKQISSVLSTARVGDVQNPFGAGFLTYDYQITQAAVIQAGFGISSLTLAGFGGFDAYVQAQPIPNTVGHAAGAPITATRYVDTSGSGTDPNNGLNLITFNFNPLETGDVLNLIVYTHVNPAYGSYIPGTTGPGQSFVAGRNYQNQIDSLAPAPEPSTVASFAFVGLGLTALAFRARRGRANLTA